MIEKIKKWLDEPGNTKAKLAAFMGYSTTDSISKWLSRGSVPPHKIKRVNKFFETQERRKRK